MQELRARLFIIMGVALLAALCLQAFGDLRNIEVGGEIHIRGRYWHNVYENGIQGPAAVRIPPFFLPGRAIGPFGAAGRYDFDDRGNNLDFVEMRTRLSVDAELDRQVRAFIELESYDNWGEDFRSDHITGLDARAGTGDDVEIYQGFIEADNMYDLPLRLRIGRQELKMGKGWLVDDITTAVIGRSFDAVRLTYHPDDWTLDVWASKLAERFQMEEDGDVDFYGAYATYSGMEALSVSAYWMLIRDGRSLNDTNFNFLGEALENWFGVDDYDVTNMHTIGLRAFGNYNAFDYDLELAYQFGDAGQVGAGFKPFLYGDDGAKFDSLAADLEIGYRFDMWGSPRVYLGGAYFEGEDNRKLDFWDWINPFDRPQASVSFNRMFPGAPYSAVLEIGQDMSNFWQVRGGVALKPTEQTTASLRIAYFEIDEAFDWPLYWSVGRFRVPVAPSLPFLTQTAADDIGWTTTLVLGYAYSEDLSFQLVWEHLFPGDGLDEGSFVHRYGLEFTGGTDDDGADYFHLASRLRF